MSFSLKNTSIGKLIAGNAQLEKNEAVAVDAVSEDDFAAIAAGKLTPTVVALTSPASVAVAALMSYPTITNTTGTPVAIASKAVTIAAISDTATAANAIATLVGIINALANDVKQLYAGQASIVKTLSQGQLSEQG